jgi:hypothetical protein
MDEKQGENREVGNCKPPKDKQFKPGRSGNPKGRGKGNVSLKKLLQQKLKEVARQDKEGRKYAELIVEATILQAMKGNGAALKMVWETIEGKITQPVEVDMTVRSHEEALSELE